MSGRHETPDPRPMAVPVGFTAPPSLIEMIRTYVRREMSQQAQLREHNETFEEADDFDIPDDPPDPSTPWELNYEQAAAPFEVGPDPAKPVAASTAASDAPPPPSSPEASSPKPP